ncbi:calcium/sodium antiporter [Desulfobulbus alkaliphilus]|uniref:calcium/sodium antiporter n=1 Tax=Desulfobulbus alkaliphilus TaxID=869814 RepID=UPI001965C0B6|nr:calcium/sodium antiporter [Desulfobulbus alkaliphilus]MBM9536709.1 calcium/sodium antiporter [Desulfobulbus alkaliphilus]
MLTYFLAVVISLIVLVWSADRFIDGSAVTARYLGVSPLLIGMVVVGFGTSAPEMVVSAISAYHGNPGIALGNAYGSNIANIALILGLTALLKPIAVPSRILRKELPILALVTGLAAWQIWSGEISRYDALVLMVVLSGLMGWTIWRGMRKKYDTFGNVIEKKIIKQSMPINQAIFWLVIGLVLLIASSRVLVWGAVEIALELGVSDLLIGLTIVAIGTSLPELAASIAATRKNEHDIVLGNVIGSNLFNTLAVVGIAGLIHPMAVDPVVFYRDVVIMTVLTLSLFLFGYGFRGPGRINRWEGSALLAFYFSYLGYLAYGAFNA